MPIWVKQVAFLKTGQLPQNKNEMLAVERGPYKVGEAIGQYHITGIIAPSPWMSIPDTVLFQIVRLELEVDRPPIAPNILLVRADKREAAEHIVKTILGDSGISYTISLALDAVLAEGFKDVELDSLDTVSRLSAFLLFLALLGLCDALAAMWAAKRELWRTERALGRPARVLMLRCLGESLGYWLPGLLLAGIAASVLAYVLHVPEVITQMVMITLVFVLVALGVMVVFAWRIASFPLARVNLEGRRTWKNALIPLGCTALITSFGALLLSDALERWSFANTRIIALGADRIDIKPDYTAAQPLENAQCQAIAELVQDCFAYGVVHAPPTIHGKMIDQWGAVTLMNAASAHLAHLELLEGHWPVPGSHQVALSQTAYTLARGLGVTMGSRLDEQGPFVLVGVVKDYAGKDSPDFASPIFADTHDSLFNRFPRVMPLGTSGMVVHTHSPLEQTIKAIRKRIGSRVSVERPAAIMLNYKAKAERDLFRIGLLLSIAAIITLQVFASFVNNLIIRIGMEVALWRTLGMTRSRVARQLLGLTLEPIIIGVLTALVILVGSLSFGCISGNLWLVVSVLLGIALFLIFVSGGVALALVQKWTRLSPRELLLNLEST